MSLRSMVAVFGFAMAVTGIGLGGCDKAEEAKPEPAKNAATEPPKPTQPIIPPTQVMDWCPEHGVPESVCTRCNESLSAAFKAKGDWDEKHGLPKSHCFECDPTLKAKFAADYKAKYGKDAPAGGADKH